MSWRDGGGVTGGGRRLHWSNNEFLAHKKNVGEEARLLGRLDVILRRRVLATSGVEAEVRRVRSDLRGVRTSTGHSVEALPPTPFRLHRLSVGGHRTSSIQLLPMTSPDPHPSANQRLPAISPVAQWPNTVGRGDGVESQGDPWDHHTFAQLTVTSDPSRLSTRRSSTSLPPWGRPGQGRGTTPRGQRESRESSPMRLDSKGDQSKQVKRPADESEFPLVKHKVEGRRSSNVNQKSEGRISPNVNHKSVEISPSVNHKSEGRRSPNVNHKSVERSPSVNHKSEGRRSPNVNHKSEERSPNVNHRSVERSLNVNLKSEGRRPHNVNYKSEKRSPNVNHKSTSGNYSARGRKFSDKQETTERRNSSHVPQNAEDSESGQKKQGSKRWGSSPVNPTAKRSQHLDGQDEEGTVTPREQQTAPKSLFPPTKRKTGWIGSSKKETESSLSVYGSMEPEGCMPAVLEQNNEGNVSLREFHAHQLFTPTPGVLTTDLTRSGPRRRYSVDFKVPEPSEIKHYPRFFGENDISPEEDIQTVSDWDVEQPSSIKTSSENPSQNTSAVVDKSEPEDSDADVFKRRRSSAASCVTPVAKEISDLLDSVRQKNEELLALALNPSPEEQQDQEGLQDQLKLLKVRSRRSEAPSLPNTRYKCRTCIERVRDKQGQHSFLEMRNQQGGKLGMLSHVPVKDLDGNVLQAAGGTRVSQRRDKVDTVMLSGSDNNNGSTSDGYHHHHNNNSNAGACRRYTPGRAPHYSRTRLDQLAQPKGGPRPRVHISGRALRRQAEAMRRPHRDARLSHREQERVLRLQSRVRLFLAVLQQQQRQMPGSMVHIPQRDDVMQVDISHLPG